MFAIPENLLVGRAYDRGDGIWLNIGGHKGTSLNGFKVPQVVPELLCKYEGFSQATWDAFAHSLRTVLDENAVKASEYMNFFIAPCCWPCLFCVVCPIMMAQQNEFDISLSQIVSKSSSQYFNGALSWKRIDAAGKYQQNSCLGYNLVFSKIHLTKKMAASHPIYTARPAPSNIATELKELTAMYEAGALDQREFSDAKARALGHGSGEKVTNAVPARATNCLSRAPATAEMGR